MATIVNIIAWICCAVLAFILIKDFIVVEKEARTLDELEGRRDGSAPESEEQEG